jgi:hypothetical protein
MRPSRSVSLAAAWLCAALLVACSGAPVRKDQSDALVLIKCDVDDAEVWVDGRYLREMRELRKGIAIAPGKHRIEVRHSEYHSLYFELDLAPRQRKRLDASLAPRLP